MNKREAMSFSGWKYLEDLSPQERYKALSDNATRLSIEQKLNTTISFSSLPGPIDPDTQQALPVYDISATTRSAVDAMFYAIFTFHDKPMIEKKEQLLLENSVEQLILPWVQVMSNAIGASGEPLASPNWLVPFPESNKNAAALVTVVWNMVPYEQGNWHVTILNTFIVVIEATIWDVEKVKKAAEEIYTHTLEMLQENQPK